MASAVYKTAKGTMRKNIYSSWTTLSSFCYACCRCEEMFTKFNHV